MIAKNKKSVLIYFLGVAFISCNVASAESANTTPTTNEKSAPIIGHGTIEGIDLEKRQLTIKHDPIKALDWPAMTMPFTVAQAIDMSQLKVGAIINFQLENDKADQRVITQIENANTHKGQ
jgi:Cu/Ag efflux protein CusF